MKSSQLILLLQVWFMGSVRAKQYKHPCPDKCGNVTIPYPFGIEEGCYLDKSYYIKCNLTTQIPSLNISSLDALTAPTDQLHVLEINIEGQLRVTLPVVYSCFDKHGITRSGSTILVNTSRFPFSSTRNMFTGVGCDIDAHIWLTMPTVEMHCLSNCEHHEDVKNGSCLGLGCCQATIPEGMTFAIILVVATQNHSKVLSYSKCGYAFIAEKDTYSFHVSDLSTLRSNISFPLVLDWSVGNTTCEEAQKDNKTYMCQENTICYNGEGGLLGYRCKCSDGFMGNPYVKNGCQDVNECESANDCLPGRCENTYGSYNCLCPKGHQGTARKGGKCTPVERRSVIKGNDTLEGVRRLCTNTSHSNVAKMKLMIRRTLFKILIEAGVGEGIAGAALTLMFVYLGANKRKRIKGRKDFFKQNGGIMLQKMLFTCKDPINRAKIFTEEELKKATDNFNEANLIGQGGYGTVYKGILPNKTQVAIKKSKIIDQSQIKQFVNEVILLSQINHPNIVKLLGCCLETHVPLLVYEYITNNTLCHHIHTNNTLSFRKRLKIAAETADALAYMHSTTQIIHCDVKPSNILLDDDFTVKVSDFGISRFIPIGQTHLSTFVKGTIGYVDPEYFRTCKLTEKSDVYSFGVVLVELLTGAKIHSLEIPLTAYRGAAAYLASLLESDSLIQVLDGQLKRDEYSEVVKSVAKLAVNCLDLEGKARPTMKEVEQALEQLTYVLLTTEAESI